MFSLRTRIASAIAMVFLLSVVAQLGATASSVVKHRPVHVKIYATIFSVRVGDPLYEGDLCDGDSATIDQPWWATDLSTVQTDVATALTSTNSVGAVVPDPVDPGKRTMPRLNDYLVATVGRGYVVRLPDLARESTDTFVAPNLDAWIRGGVAAPPPESVFSFVNGTCSSLPGVKVGLSEIVFDPLAGWVNSNPLTGNVYVLGEIDLVAPVPEPSALLALGGGLLSLAGMAVRRRR